MRLTRKQSYIRISNVQPPSGQRMNWGKYVYFGVLFLILGVILFYVARGLIYIEGTGQVIIEKVYVQHTSDIRLVKIHVKEGDKVRKGRPLFDYLDERSDVGAVSGGFSTDLERERLRVLQSAGMKRLDQNAHREALAALMDDLQELQRKKASGRFSGDLERERLRTVQAIRLKEVEVNDHRQRLASLQTDYDRMKKQVLLETYLPDRLNDLSAGIRATEQAVKKTGEEIATLTIYLQELEGVSTDEKALLEKIRAEKQALKAAGAETSLLDQYIRRLEGLGGGQPISGHQTFLAPQDGVVTRVYLSDYEVALKGTTMMEIYKPEEITIKGFFEQELVNHIQQGRQVVIKFPDGTTGSGIISKSYFATVPLPPEFQKKYEPLQRSIAVDIVPTSQEDALKWKNFYKLSVTLYIKRGLG